MNPKLHEKPKEFRIHAELEQFKNFGIHEPLSA